MEEGGTQLTNVRKNDIITRYGGAVVVVLVFVTLMGGLIALTVQGLTAEPAEAPSLGLMLFLPAIPDVVITGVLLALRQYIKQIRGGGEDAASKY